MKTRIRFSLDLASIRVRKSLPSHIVAQRAHPSRKAYNRKRQQRAACGEW